jgi:hypothetical protein
MDVAHPNPEATADRGTYVRGSVNARRVRWSRG